MLPQIVHFSFFGIPSATPDYCDAAAHWPLWFTISVRKRDALWPIWCGRYRRVADIDVACGRYGVLCGRYGCGRYRLWPISSFPVTTHTFGTSKLNVKVILQAPSPPKSSINCRQYTKINSFKISTCLPVVAVVFCDEELFP